MKGLNEVENRFKYSEKTSPARLVLSHLDKDTTLPFKRTQAQPTIINQIEKT
ncbi:hypothetical protein L4D04_23730 [Photobacterium angustum]|uniref:hypothetical protein n=1 Tax=Photobacterium angustum TaxID=661 RepID=UPI003D0ACECB